MLLGACKKILSCSSKTCNEAVWGDLGVEPLARFLIRNGVNVNYEVEGGNSGKNV